MAHFTSLSVFKNETLLINRSSVIFVLSTILYQILLDFEALWKPEIVGRHSCKLLSCGNLFLI